MDDSDIVCLFLDPDPPAIKSVVLVASTIYKITWRAASCNFGYPRGIRVSFSFSATREFVYEGVFNETFYDSENGVGTTLVHSENFVSGSSYMVVISILYNGKPEPVWSQPSPAFFSSPSGTL